MDLKLWAMSRMYYWAQAFMELYPNEMKVYYEDNKFICYKIEQNMYHQYDFAIDYRYNQNKMQDETAEDTQDETQLLLSMNCRNGLLICLMTATTMTRTKW